MQSMPPIPSKNASGSAPQVTQSNESGGLTSAGNLQRRNSSDDATLPFTPTQIMQFQKTIGNRATAQLVVSRSPLKPNNHPNGSGQSRILSEDKVKPSFQLKNGDFLKGDQVQDSMIQRTIVTKTGSKYSDEDKKKLFNKANESFEIDEDEFEDKFSELNKMKGKHTIRVTKEKLVLVRYIDTTTKRKKKKAESAAAHEKKRRSKEDANYATSSLKRLANSALITVDPLSIELRSRALPVLGSTSDTISLSDYFESGGEEKEEEKKVVSKKVLALATGPNARPVDIMNLDVDTVNELVSNAQWYKEPGGIILANIPKLKKFVEFHNADERVIEKFLCIRYALINVEPQPRSGIARAAADEYDKRFNIINPEKTREPARLEASYKARIHKPDSRKFEEKKEPVFTAQRTANKLKVTITHLKPGWIKGDRGAGQADVMGGQSAKNHVIDSMHEEESTNEEKEAARTELGGRFEWLHIIGSSLGGLNTPNNLVAGSYDMNTKMIVLEHKIARMAQEKKDEDAGEDAEEKGYKFIPSEEEPLVIEGTADVVKNTNVGTNINLTVSHGDNEIISEDYKVDDQRVLYRNQYIREENRIREKLIAKKKELAADVDERDDT
ncbi:hypothetical protein [Paenibacillus sp. SI8]|uniref:hypothetical protein n=1 Tax=unclassified Paenibacillus TaxID=185978 RepID=UPI003467E500